MKRKTLTDLIEARDKRFVLDVVHAVRANKAIRYTRADFETDAQYFRYQHMAAITDASLVIENSPLARRIRNAFALHGKAARLTSRIEESGLSRVERLLREYERDMQELLAKQTDRDIGEAFNRSQLALAF